jgi:hypothetical protein
VSVAARDIRTAFSRDIDMNPTNDTFLKFDYAEVKDLATRFLTLISGILVLSITFSDRVAKNASAKRYLVTSWACFISAIIASGLALACMFYSGLQASHPEKTYQSWGDFQSWGEVAYGALEFGGIVFVAGLILLMMSAISAYKKHQS